MTSPYPTANTLLYTIRHALDVQDGTTLRTLLPQLEQFVTSVEGTNLAFLSMSLHGQVLALLGHSSATSVLWDALCSIDSITPNVDVETIVANLRMLGLLAIQSGDTTKARDYFAWGLSVSETYLPTERALIESLRQSLLDAIQRNRLHR
ncbi:MAG: hypothetical protein AAGF95_11055 [Chloroflexota bacterium]